MDSFSVPSTGIPYSEISVYCWCATGGCGMSFTIHIDSEQFRGKRALQQHRMVNEVRLFRIPSTDPLVVVVVHQALGEEMKEIHSVSIKIGSPND